MRDLVLFAALAGVGLLMFMAPQRAAFLGVLTWLWLSLMNPHREVFSFLSGSTLNLYVTLLTVAAWSITPERKLPPPNPFTVLIMLFALWATVTTSLAIDRGWSMPLWVRMEKTMALVLAVVMLANTRVRVQAVVWVVAISLGFYGVKGGLFVLLTGGRHPVMGPQDSMIGDNNNMGLALVILLPLLNYLRMTSRVKVVRLACLGACGLTLLAILGTYSRGALVATGAALATYVVRSRSGVVVLLAAAALVTTAPHILPSAWFARMQTIQTAKQDESFGERLQAWRTSLNIAEARPIFGGGFSATEQAHVIQQYESEGSLDVGRAAHSVYFQVLADHGFVGLAIYLLAVGAAVLNTMRVLAETRGRPDLQWANQLARMLQVSIAGFLVGGAALSMAYYDGMLVIFALTASLTQAVRASPRAKLAEGAEPRWKALAREAPLPGASGSTG